MLGTQFTIFDRGVNPKQKGANNKEKESKTARRELAAIAYVSLLSKPINLKKNRTNLKKNGNFLTKNGNVRFSNYLEWTDGLFRTVHSKNENFWQKLKIFVFRIILNELVDSVEHITQNTKIFGQKNQDLSLFRIV